VLKHRTRTVTFRVTEEEYETLQKLCALQGERCLSDLARAAMARLLIVDAGNDQDHRLASQVQDLASRVHQLETRIQSVREEAYHDK